LAAADGPNAALIGFGRPSPAAQLVPLRGGRAAVATLAALGGILLNPVWGLCVVLALLLALDLALSVFRSALAVVGLRRPAQARRPPSGREEELPAYTVLVPLYDEANVVPSLVRHLSRLEYPADRLEILLLCEARDVGTIDAVQAAVPDSRFRLLIAPDGEPRTKPRACNLALAQARGELCVIYDAEDRPDLDQLRLAAEMFAASEPAVLCLQARLDFHNHACNWLTRSFTVDYAYRFDLFLPALAALGLPVPLGGTSNHFLVDRLNALGGWDPYNVTEDADLGMRIYRAGARTDLLDSTTSEEACSRAPAWTRQRTRWMKGHLQTWLVHTRSPSFREIPWGARNAFRALIGVEPVVAALGVPQVGLSVGALILLLTSSTLLPGAVPMAVLAVTLGSSVLSVGTGAVAVRARRRPDLVTAVLSTPAYKLLAGVAAYRAIWQLFRRPHYWEKTPHGLSGAATDPGRVG
jgi:hypothetical protein